MIDKVESGKKYRLIDKEGYASSPKYGSANRQLLVDKDVFDENMCVVIQYVANGCGMTDGALVISPPEYRLFELVEENEMQPKEPKIITPETEVTITTTYGELARIYYALGDVNGKTRGKDVWTVVGDTLGDLGHSIYFGNEPNLPTVDYTSIQEKWESLFFKSREQQEKELAIKQKRDMIAKLQKEIQELGGE